MQELTPTSLFMPIGTSEQRVIFKGKKMVSVDRDLTLSPNYYSIFMKRYVR